MAESGLQAPEQTQVNKISNDEVLINGVIVPKRKMNSSTNDSIYNGVELTVDVTFGNYQQVIDKNAYYIGDDEIVYLNGRRIVCFELMKKKQSFVPRRIEDSDASAMNVFVGKRSNNQSMCLIAVALKGSLKELPTIIVYDKTPPNHNQIVLSHLGLNMNIVSVAFVYKGRFLAVLVEIEAGVLYHLAVCGVTSASGTFYKEELRGNFKRIEQCLAENSIFTVMSDSHINVYQLDPKGETVTPQVEKTAMLADGLKTSKDDPIVDHCWLDNEKKLIVATRTKLFVFDSYVLEQSWPFEFPGSEFKRLLKDKRSDALLEEMYTSAENIIDYFNPSTSEDFHNKKHPDYLLMAIEQEMTKMGYTEPLIHNSEEEKAMMRRIFNELSTKILNQRNIRINCLCKQENGFAVGFRGAGIIAMFKKRKDGFFLDSCSSIKQKDVDMICSMASSQDDNHIVVNVRMATSIYGGLGDQDSYGSAKDSNQPQGSLEVVVFNSSLVNTIKNSSMEPFEFLFPFGSHSAPIHGLAVVPTKSFAVTISRDKTLKIWQYSGDQRQLYSFEFASYESSKQDIPFDIHPLSCQIAIGLKGLKIQFLVEGELVVAYENFMKQCTAVAYASRGHLLAVGYEMEIHIIDPYSFEFIRTIKRHSAHIKSLQWVGNDRYLISLCNNSAIFVWDTWNDYNPVLDDDVRASRSGKITAVAYDPEFDLLVVCCDNGLLRIYKSTGVELLDEFQVDNAEGVVFTTVLISKKLQVIFFGTNKGDVRIYLWPLIKLHQIYESRQLFIHQGAITSIKLTPNFEYLVTTAEDCSVYFSKIIEKSKGQIVGMADPLSMLNENARDLDMVGRISNAFSLNEFTWMSNARKEKIMTEMGELEVDLQSKITDIDVDNEKLTDKHNKMIQEREHSNQETVKKMNTELANKMDEEGAKQKSLELECKEVKNSLKELIRVKEEEHRNQLLALYREREEIERQMDNFRNGKDRDLNESTSRFNSILEKAKADFEKNKTNINSQYKQAILYLKEDQKKFQEALRQTEEEYNILIETTEKDLNDKLREKKKTTEQIRSNYFKLVKNNQKNKERTSNLTKLIEETQLQNEQLQADINSFNEKYREMEDRLNQQENVINLKEAKIKEYRNKNYHLQNFKSVYDYQVQTLKEAHEPLTEYVNKLEQHIKTMYNELLSEADASKALGKNIEGLDEEIEEMKKAVKKDTRGFRETKRQFDVLEHDLVQATLMQDGEGFKSKLTELLEHQIQYVNKIESKLTLSGTAIAQGLESGKGQSLEKLSAVELDSIRKELTRQRDTLSKKLIRNTETNVRLEKERESVFKQIQEEGETLISKCNSLRRNGLVLRFQIGLKEKEAKELKDQMGAQEIREEELAQAAAREESSLAASQKGIGQSGLQNSGFNLGAPARRGQPAKSVAAVSEPRLPKHKPALPYIDYKKRAEAARPKLAPVQEERDVTAGQMVTRVMKQFEKHSRLEKLQDEARASGMTAEQYQTKINNFANAA